MAEQAGIKLYTYTKKQTYLPKTKPSLTHVM